MYDEGDGATGNKHRHASISEAVFTGLKYLKLLMSSRETFLVLGVGVQPILLRKRLGYHALPALRERWMRLTAIQRCRRLPAQSFRALGKLRFARPKSAFFESREWL